MDKKICILAIILLSLFSCKTIHFLDDETAGNIIYKNLVNKSKKIDNISISGLLKITGVKEIPSVYIQFESQGRLKEKSIVFKIYSFKKPIFEISIEKEKVLFINHTGKEYVKCNIEEIDLSKFTGINFNPIDLAYFFSGNIPFSENMELMNFKKSKKYSTKQYSTMEITDNISKYSITLDKKQKIISVEILNQYFDALLLESIKYKKNKKRIDIPNMLTFSSKESATKIYFIINNISLQPIKGKLIEPNKIKKYKELSSLSDVNIVYQKNK